MKYSFIRWVVITMIAIATLICFIERQAFAVLWPFIGGDLFPDKSPQEMKETYASISVLFIITLTVGFLISGKVFDWIGTRIGFTVLMIVGGLATIAHAFSKGVFTLGLSRIMLGVSDSGKYPGAIKANAEFLPSQESALGISLINISSSIAGFIAIPVIAYLALNFSWQTIFIMLGLSSFVWLIPWMILVKSMPKKPMLNEQESVEILDGEQTLSRVDETTDKQTIQSIWQVLSHKQSWGIIAIYVALEPIWLLCITWLPIYLVEAHEMDLKELAVHGWQPYAGSVLGTLASGVLAFVLIKSGWTINKTRKLIITTGCLILLLSLIAIMVDSNFVFISVAMFGLTFALCNIETLPRDFFDTKVLGRLSGVMLFIAGIVSAITTSLVPWLSYGGDYTNVLLLAIGFVLVAIVSFWLLCSKIERLQLKK